MSTQYISADIAPVMTWSFNTLTIINNLIFSYFLHKISKRVPIPFQWEEDDENDIPTHCSPIKSNAISLDSLNRQQLKASLALQNIDYNLHPNKYINTCCIWLYKLLEPVYPSYYFDDITSDRRKELLENHWNTIQDQTANDSALQSPDRETSHATGVTAPSYAGKSIFAITAQKMTGLVFKKRSYIQYLSLSLRLWSVALGIIALALTWSFWMNMLLEYCIACIFNRGNYAQLLGLLAIFAIVHCANWWLRRQWQSLKLLWFNTSDHYRVMIGIIWRFINLLLCLSFTLWSSFSRDTVSDSVFWQLFLRWMVGQGLVWEIGYCVMCFCCNIWVVYRIYFLQYNFLFMKKLGRSHLKSIRKTINNISNLFTEDSATKKRSRKHSKENVQTILEDESMDATIEERKYDDDDDEKEDEDGKERRISDTEIHDLTQLHEIEVAQQNILKSMQSRNIHQDMCDTFLELFCVLKQNDNRDEWCCCNRIRLVYIQYLYVIMVIVSIIVCFAVADDDLRSQCKFAGIMLTMYYCIVLFRRAKYNALYCFWSSKYHARFFGNLQIIHSFETQKRMESRAPSEFRFHMENIHGSPVKDGGEKLLVGLLVADGNPLSFDQAVAGSDGSMEHKAIDENQSNADYVAMEDDTKEDIIKSNQQKAKMYSDIDNKEIIVFKDPHRNIFVKTISIDYMDYWSMIDLSDNDYYGCNVFCSATKELCGLICALIFIGVFVTFAIIFSNSAQSAQTSVYAHDATDNVITPYPMCEVKFARNYLNLLDMIYITEAAYWPDKSKITHMFDIWFGNDMLNGNASRWEFDKMYIRTEKPAFFHITNTNGLDVVAVRGTNTMDDVLEDISLYTEISTLQTFSWVIPLTTVLPTGFIRDFINYASIPEGMIDPQLRARYDEPIYDYVEQNMQSSFSKTNVEGGSNKTVFVMGHSLGGGIAEIVAAKLADEGYTNVYSFGLSSPGTLWSSMKFGFSVEALDKSSISVLPRRDPVSVVDKHGGVSQVIECDAKQVLFCHYATRSFCEIFQECGNDLVRNLTFAKCLCGNATRAAHDWDQCW